MKAGSSREVGRPRPSLLVQSRWLHPEEKKTDGEDEVSHQSLETGRGRFETYLERSGRERHVVSFRFSLEGLESLDDLLVRNVTA